MEFLNGIDWSNPLVKTFVVFQIYLLSLYPARRGMEYIGVTRSKIADYHRRDNTADRDLHVFFGVVCSLLLPWTALATLAVAAWQYGVGSVLRGVLGPPLRVIFSLVYSVFIPPGPKDEGGNDRSRKS